MNKLLHLTKPGLVEEYDWELPAMKNNQIRIKTIMTGVCRSDIGNFSGLEAMPYASKEHPNGIIGTWGHEGLGEILEIGSEINDVKPGDIVSTFSDPAYSFEYYAKKGEYTKIPEANPKFILQPVACGVNIWMQTVKMMTALKMNPESRILLIGSGFLSMIIAKTFEYLKEVDHIQVVGQEAYLPFHNLHVVGKANRSFWGSNKNIKTFLDISEINSKYDAVIDLSSRPEYFDLIVNKLCRIEGLVCYASTPTSPITTNFFNACWQCLNFILPSPRNSDFINAMTVSQTLISHKLIEVEDQWSEGYARSDMNQVRKAFKDGANRKPGYIRGYIDFRK